MQISQLLMLTALSIMASTILTSIEIPILKHKQFRQFIREEGPQSHLSKEGTPTMGGIAIFAALVLMTFIGGYVTIDTYVMIAVTLLFGLIGFFDDYIKVAKKHNLGLRAWQKLVLQILFAVGLAVYMAEFSGYGTEVWIPFIDRYVDFGWMYIPFVAFVDVYKRQLLDLGVSSFQLDNSQRGFSYMHDAPLDMRMNQDDAFTAFDVVNGYSQQELARIISAYGEEKWAGSCLLYTSKMR